MGGIWIENGSLNLVLQITMEFVLGLYDAAASLEAQKRHDAALATMPPEDRRGKKR